MMKVPDNVVPFAQPQAAPQVDPKYLAMAAGLMHQEGRLFEPAADRLYEDDNGHQRSLENDKTIDQFRPQIDDMAGRINDTQADILHRWFGNKSGKVSPEEGKSIKPFLDEADSVVKDLPSSKQEGNIIQMYNWRGLLMDEVLRSRKNRSGV